MSDPSPDTPNVCPTCRSTQPAARHTGRWWRLTDGTVDDSRHGPCPDEWHACPAARSSPPDYTALAEQLRAVKHYESEDCWYSCPESEEGCCNDGRTGCDCHAPTMWAAADALEAQAARITELETALRPFLRLMEPDGGWHVLDDDVLEIDDSTALAPGEADAIRAQRRCDADEDDDECPTCSSRCRDERLDLADDATCGAGWHDEPSASPHHMMDIWFVEGDAAEFVPFVIALAERWLR